MAYIGKVLISSEWAKLEDLIKAQVSGQSSFAFDSDKDYSIQIETSQPGTSFGAYACNSASTPAGDDDGEHLSEEQFVEYKPESGSYLYIKTRGGSTDVKVAVSEK